MQIIGEYGLLLGGRSEILVSTQAILDSPIIGHGSNAKNCRYALLHADLRRRAGYVVYDIEELECQIPTHSHLMGAWVQAGVFGVFFWVWAIALAVRTLSRFSQDPLAPLVAFVAFFLLWDIFFSGFAGDRRFMTPFYLVVMMTVLSIRESQPLARVRPLRTLVN